MHILAIRTFSTRRKKLLSRFSRGSCSCEAVGGTPYRWGLRKILCRGDWHWLSKVGVAPAPNARSNGCSATAAARSRQLRSLAAGGRGGVVGRRTRQKRSPLMAVITTYGLKNLAGPGYLVASPSRGGAPPIPQHREVTACTPARCQDVDSARVDPCRQHALRNRDLERTWPHLGRCERFTFGPTAVWGPPHRSPWTWLAEPPGVALKATREPKSWF